MPQQKARKGSASRCLDTWVKSVISKLYETNFLKKEIIPISENDNLSFSTYIGLTFFKSEVHLLRKNHFCAFPPIFDSLFFFSRDRPLISALLPNFVLYLWPPLDKLLKRPLNPLLVSNKSMFYWKIIMFQPVPRKQWIMVFHSLTKIERIVRALAAL